MRARSALVSSDRSTMHHKKQKANLGGSGTAKDARFEAMQRLRYLNKKPLCLQYNVQNQNGRRNVHLKNKGKEQSFLVVLIVGLVRLVQYLMNLAQSEFWDFVLKPADQLFPAERSISPTKTGSRTRRRPSLSKKYINCTYRRDFGRTARIMELREQRTQLCYF